MEKTGHCEETVSWISDAKELQHLNDVKPFTSMWLKEESL